MTTICMRASGDTPLLYFYSELDDAARREFERHVSTCRDCAAALDELQQVRAALADRARVTRSPGDWNAFMRRLEAVIDEGNEVPHTRLRARAPWFAVAAALLVGIGLGLVWQQRALGPRESQVSTAAVDGLPALEAAAGRHFERAKLVVLGLAMKDPASTTATDWEYERALAASLLPETRLFRLSAEERGDARLAGLLGDLETVLLQAAMSADAEAPELRRLQRIIRGRDLIVRMDTTRGL